MSGMRPQPEIRLARALRAGALYDWLLAAIILVAHPALFRLFRTPPPVDLFHFRVNSLALVLLGLLYWETARDPLGRRWATRLAALIRFVGGALLILITLAHRPAGAGTFLAFGMLDFAWGALLVALLRAGSKKYPPSQGDDGG
ncbi:MAG TPA: hypothetical protein VF720_15235 [Candidatus Eisenbacteria bacterium]